MEELAVLFWTVALSLVWADGLMLKKSTADNIIVCSLILFLIGYYLEFFFWKISKIMDLTSSPT